MIYFLAEGRIPYNLDLDKLISNIDGNKTYKQKIKEGTIYFLSLLTVIEDCPEYWLYNGYLVVNDVRLAKIVGKGGVKSRTSVIKNLLVSNGIVDFIPFKFKKRSMAFRLHADYDTGEYINIPFSNSINQNLEKYESIDKVRYSNFIDKTYSHLKYNFNHHDFSILEDRLKIAIISVVNLAITLTKGKRKYRLDSLKAIFSYFGKNILLLQKLVQKNYNLSVSLSNYRLTSSFTMTPKFFRKFLQINGKDIAEIDIKSCQVYLLACILRGNFTNSSDSGFFLNAIYPELSNRILNFDVVNPTKQTDRKNNYLGIYLNEFNANRLNEFCEFDFKNADFYDHVYNVAMVEYPNIFKKIFSELTKESGRDKVKSDMMNYLFNDEEIHRFSNGIVNILSMKYEVLEYILNSFFNYFSKRDLAILLQRCEAYLILEEATRNVHISNSKIPIFTVHDCIVTTIENILEVKSIVEVSIEKITNKPVGLKSVVITGGEKFKDQEVKEILNKTIINNKKQLDRSISNTKIGHIEAALNFLFRDSPEELDFWHTQLIEI